MNKKILFLSILFIILVSALVSYTYYNQTINKNNSQTGSSGTISDTTLNNEIDSSLLDENQGVQIGEMV
jgi:peptidoglycan hydrolase CwlO-like protein